MVVWISYLKTNSEALSAFFEWVQQRETSLLAEMRAAVTLGDLSLAQQAEGAIKELDTLRKAATITDNETRAYQEYKDLLNGNGSGRGHQ